MTWAVTTPPVGEPVSLAEAKLHLRVDHDLEDELIEVLITASRIHVESVCERALLPQTWAERSESFPARVELRGGVVTAVNSVTYLDASGLRQAVDVSTCVTDLDSEPAIVMAPFGTQWPDARRQPGSVAVTYRVGYPDADSVPAPLKQAILLYIGDLYANRSAQQEGQLFHNAAATALLWPYRRVQP